MSATENTLAAIHNKMFTDLLKDLESKPENAGLQTLEPELYPFMSPRELRMAILLGTHSNPKFQHFTEGLLFTSSLNSNDCDATVSDGSSWHTTETKTDSGIDLKFKGLWMVDSRYGNSSLGQGSLVLQVRELDSGGGDSFFRRFNEDQNFCIHLNDAGEEDELFGELIINPKKWDVFVKTLSQINEKSWSVRFGQVFGCFNRDDADGIRSFRGPIFSIGGTFFSVHSGAASAPEKNAFNHKLMIKKPEFITQDLIEYVMGYADVGEVEAKKIIMKLPPNDYAAISSHPSSLDMALGFELLKKWGLNPKIQAASNGG